MNIKIKEENKIEKEMMEQVKDAITSFGEIISETVSSLLAQNFLTVNKEAKKLSEDMRDIFHSVTAKLLYLENRHGPTLKWQYLFCATD